MSRIDFDRFVQNKQASLVSFDNTANNFVATNVQDAIEEAGDIAFFRVEDNVQQTTTAAGYVLLNNMSFTLPVGTWLVQLEVEFETVGTSAAGNIGIFENSLLIPNSVRTQKANDTGLGGADIRNTLNSSAVVIVTTNTLIQGGFNELGNDTVNAFAKAMTALRLQR